MTRLSIVVPCYNEAEVVGAFHAELSRALAGLADVEVELLFVDDGSTDGTLARLNELAAADPRLRVASFSRNFGHQIALTAGLDHATGDAVITMDADLQHPPSVIPQLVAKWREGFDIVSAIRETAAGETWFKRWSSTAFYRLFNALSTTQIPEGAADFCLMSRRVYESLRGMSERHRVLRGLLAWTGYARAAISYVQAPRAAGHSKYGLGRMVALALDAVMSFSAEPLRFASRLGVVVTLVGLWFLWYTLWRGWRTGTLVPGYSSIIGVILLLGGCQLCFIGLIGQYLARIFEEVKGRPLYLFKQAPR